jgi:hypothetical protein
MSEHSTVEYVDQPFEQRESPLWWHNQGLSYTASGYGKKIPTSRMIRFAGEKGWRRVYVMQFSNSGTAYVIVKGQILVVRDSDLY